MERTENDFVLGYCAVTLDRRYCGHVISRAAPKARNCVLFSPDYGGIPSLILKLFLVSVKLQPILSLAPFFNAVSRGLTLAPKRAIRTTSVYRLRIAKLQAHGIDVA